MTQALDHGYVRLVDSMGDDLAIVNAARTSYNNPSTMHHFYCEKVEGNNFCNCDGSDGDVWLAKSDAGLINYLAKHRHGTPFEMVTVKFEVQAPIFVFREWHRHRIASINEMSGRYVELERLFYVPSRDNVREQKGKPGHYVYERMDSDGTAQDVREEIMYACSRSFDIYDELLKYGVAKEQARMVLPLNTYSKMVWSCNLRALFNFLSLRNHDRAQYEIRVYAEAIEELVKSVAPVALQAFINNNRQAP